MFGTVNQHLNKSWFFNHMLTAGFKNPEYKDDGTTVMMDSSSSMNSFLNEIKVLWSALGAVTGTKDDNPLPTLGGGTALADAALEISKTLGPNEKLLIITDGDDTSSKWKFDCPPDQEHDYTNAKRSAMLKMIEDLCQAEIFLVGIGDEVKDFIKTVAKKGHRTRVAHVPQGATAAQITGVLRATYNAPARDLEADATVIEIDAPEAQALQPTAEETKAIEIAAANVAVGSNMTATAFKKTFEAVEASITELASVDKSKARTAALYFMDQISKKNTPLPGALLGAKQQHIFTDPSYPQQSGWHSYLNKLLSRLNGKLLKQNPKLDSPTKYDMEGKVFNYNKVNTYSLLDSVSPAIITAIMADETWAPPQSELTMIQPGKGQKRNAEEQLTKDSEEEAASA